MNSMQPEQRDWLTPRVVFGILVVGFGMAMLLGNLHILSFGALFRYWPFALMAVGVTYLSRGDSRSERIFGGGLTVIGALLVAEVFFSFHLHIWRWWPLAIVFVGVMLITRAFQPPGDSKSQVHVGVVFGGSGTGPQPTVPGVDSRAGSVAPTYSEFALWSGIERRVSAPAFKRADLTAVMGGIEFDLRQASTDQGEAVIEVFVVWGGIEIVVPPDWAVSNQVTAIMGGVEDQSSGTQMSTHRLVIKGMVLMGGVTIKT